MELQGSGCPERLKLTQPTGARCTVSFFCIAEWKPTRTALATATTRHTSARKLSPLPRAQEPVHPPSPSIQRQAYWEEMALTPCHFGPFGPVACLCTCDVTEGSPLPPAAQACRGVVRPPAKPRAQLEPALIWNPPSAAASLDHTPPLYRLGRIGKNLRPTLAATGLSRIAVLRPRRRGTVQVPDVAIPRIWDPTMFNNPPSIDARFVYRGKCLSSFYKSTADAS